VQTTQTFVIIIIMFLKG